MIAEVPFVDVLNSILDDTLPLTPPEWPEWGNPITDVDSLRDDPRLFALRQCARARSIRRCWSLAGLTDPRVTYWEPAKWVARLRSRKTDDNPMLLQHESRRRPRRRAGRFDRLQRGRAHLRIRHRRRRGGVAGRVVRALTALGVDRRCTACWGT